MTVLLLLLHYAEKRCGSKHAARYKMQTSFINLLSDETKRYLNMYTREKPRIADDEGIVFVKCLKGISVLLYIEPRSKNIFILFHLNIV